MLDAQYRPWGGGDPIPPVYPSRLKALIYAFGQQAWEDDVKLAGGKLQRQGGG
jgi:hypothetical protein